MNALIVVESLSDVGIRKNFIEQLSSWIEPECSVLFLLGSPRNIEA